MRKKRSTRRWVSAFLLFVFIFSSTPRQWLHNLVTNHQDTYINVTADKLILTTSGFHCNCDNLVVQSPFINYDGPADLTIPAFFVLYQAAAIPGFISAPHLFSELRGPPVIS